MACDRHWLQYLLQPMFAFADGRHHSATGSAAVLRFSFWSAAVELKTIAKHDRLSFNCAMFSGDQLWVNVSGWKPAKSGEFTQASRSVWLCLFVFLWAATTPGAESHKEDSITELPVVRGRNIPEAKEGLGSWIWTDKTFDRQSCRLWKQFEIPAKAKVVSARMRMTADNGYRLFLNGRELGQGADWRGLTEYDLTELLRPGRHVLAVDAFNDILHAGLILGLEIHLDDGRKLAVQSDATWCVVPEPVRGWEKLERAHPDWPHAVIIPTESVSYWKEPSWPFDYVKVPPLHPVIIPIWQKPVFHIVLVSVSGLAFLGCVALIIRLTIHSKEQQLLNHERARIARDIHDDFGTRLTRLVLEGEVAKSEVSGNSSASERLSRITTGLREALGAMDEVLWAVNPRRDTVKDFVTYICEYAQTFLQPTRIECRLDVEAHLPPLGFDLPLRRSLLLAVKEAINNVAKHSQASTMTLCIHQGESNLVVVVEDNGIGFQTGHTGEGRNGLANIIQRMSDVGGTCRISSQPGKGCRVEFRMPLTRNRPRLPGMFRFRRIKSKVSEADSHSANEKLDPGCPTTIEINPQ
jgi:Histidine kinase/Histidine kinase-, DNA gyrase B-, and HSP90-like ATPase